MLFSYVYEDPKCKRTSALDTVKTFNVNVDCAIHSLGRGGQPPQQMG